jgi:hippurate hydrolase
MIKPATLIVASVLFARVAVVPASCEAATETSADPQAWAQQNVPELVTLYRYLHRHPELSFHEKETAALLAQMWQSLGATVSTDIGGHGIVGLLKNGDGATVMLRCDLDGLPVVEETNLAYSSKERRQGRGSRRDARLRA